MLLLRHFYRSSLRFSYDKIYLKEKINHTVCVSKIFTSSSKSVINQEDFDLTLSLITFPPYPTRKAVLIDKVNKVNETKTKCTYK